MQKMTILTSAVPEISPGALKFKEGHVTLSRPLSRVIVILMLGLDVA